MGEGLGVRVRVPAVVTFPASANNYQLSIDYPAKTSGPESEFSWGVGSRNSPIPQVEGGKIVISSYLFKFVIVLGYF